MKFPRQSLAIALLSIILLMPELSMGKDDPITLEKCPAPVQTIIKQYSAQATLEEVALDKKSKSGGPQVYEAKFTAKDGQRFELHISPDGKIIEIEKKKPKL